VKKLIIILVAFLSTGCAFLSKEHFPQVKIGDQEFLVEVANTDQGRARGLMFRESMPKDHGMLFVFEETKPHSFWMKNTILPLDMVWIDAENKIVDIQTALPCPPETECPSYVPEKAAKYVLEVNLGVLNAEIGDKVKFVNID
jgi:uncharacterized membrane protein (UPF0127 family)